MEDYRATGLRMVADLMGQAQADSMASNIATGGHVGGLSGLAVDFAFGAVWTREGLERKQRSLVVIGILVALRQQSELQHHVRIALKNGLTPREIEEAVLQAVPYVGFPAVATATAAMGEVLREQGLREDGAGVPG